MVIKLRNAKDLDWNNSMKEKDTTVPYVSSVYTLETLIKTIIPTAIFGTDELGQVIIFTQYTTDEDGNLTFFEVTKND